MSSPETPPARNRDRTVIALSVVAMLVLVALLGAGSAFALGAFTSSASPSHSDSDDEDEDEDEENEDEDDEDAAEIDGRACVILPDSASAPRWEATDRPYFEQAFEDAGIEYDVQNAQGDESKYASIAEEQLDEGCGVMILADYNGAATQIAEDAHDQGVPVIAYDRPLFGADYYIGYDPVEVGSLEGRSIVDGLTAAGIDPAEASVVYVGGDPNDGNAQLFHDGAEAIMEAAGITPAYETEGTWDGPTAGTSFAGAYTALGGNIDAVWAANDYNAAAVITVLDSVGLTVPVSGQDASTAGLQNVLLGKQTGTVYKPASLEAEAAVELAITLLSGDEPSIGSHTTDDGVPFIAISPILVGPDQVQAVVAAGDASASDICTGAVATACQAYGVG